MSEAYNGMAREARLLQCALRSESQPKLAAAGFFVSGIPQVIVASGIAIQFGAKPLFSDVSVKFGGGNRYGLIGANGCGKSTFMKILGRELEPTAGTIAIDANERVGRLRQDQFAHEAERVLDVVMMGHEEMWAAMNERDAIYANPQAGEDDYLRAADLEHKYAEYGGYTAEARAGELLLGLGVPTGRVDTYAFGLGSGIAGLAGCALSQIGNVGPDLGQSYIVDSFMVVVLGGVGQLAGTVYAALGLGFANKLLEAWQGAVLAKIAVLVFIIFFIQKRPQGMFALKGRALDA